MSEAFSLVKYDAMCHAIDAAYEVDEVAPIRDKALAMELYLRQQRNTEAERRACEIRLRAERKLGQLMQEEPRAQGQRSDVKTSSERATKSFKAQLDQHGIRKDQAYRWQQLARVPEEQFEAALAAPVKPSTSGIIARAEERAATVPAHQAPPAPKPQPMDEHALWLWGRLRDFERDGILDRDPEEVLNAMTDAMQADVLRLIPLVRDWLEELCSE